MFRISHGFLALLLSSVALPAMAQNDGANGDQPGANGDQSAGQQSGDTVETDIISLSDWRYDELYSDGRSAQYMMDVVDVHGENGDEIGSVEDLIIDAQGRVVSVIAEVGGFWDIGDTHISVPYEEVSFDGDGVVVPVTEDNLDDYGLFEGWDEQESVSGAAASGDVTAGVDDAPVTGRAWRVSELIGDYARLNSGNENRLNYGYVNDAILRDGEIAAVVITPDVGYGATGSYAYPYYGYGDAGMGWNPGDRYYDLPYAEDELSELPVFEDTEMQNQG